jgi:tetratricopeptide (TPR) repeat protein
MKYLLIVALSTMLFSDPGKIGRINSIKSQARKAFNSGDYKQAIEKYKFLVDSLKVDEDEVKLNLASAYYLSKDTANAMTHYQSVSSSDNKIVRSKAQQQLGVMSDRQGRFDEALSHFKQAIQADPQNDDARYNYEMLKKKMAEKDKKNKDDKKNDKENKPDKPSEYAKKLKAQADALSAQFRFSEAHSLMLEGAKKDRSVMFYSDFIERLNDVNTINKPK